MKAPDKIFLAFEHGFVAQASTSKEDANGNSIFLSKYNPIEYLRKDILLKLLREKRVAVIECSATNERKVAALSVLDFLIDKIKLL